MRLRRSRSISRRTSAPVVTVPQHFPMMLNSPSAFFVSEISIGTRRRQIPRCRRRPPDRHKGRLVDKDGDCLSGPRMRDLASAQAPARFLRPFRSRREIGSAVTVGLNQIASVAASRNRPGCSCLGALTLHCLLEALHVDGVLRWRSILGQVEESHRCRRGGSRLAISRRQGRVQTVASLSRPRPATSCGSRFLQGARSR